MLNTAKILFFPVEENNPLIQAASKVFSLLGKTHVSEFSMGKMVNINDFLSFMPIGDIESQYRDSLFVVSLDCENIIRKIAELRMNRIPSPVLFLPCEKTEADLNRIPAFTENSCIIAEYPISIINIFKIINSIENVPELDMSLYQSRLDDFRENYDTVISLAENINEKSHTEQLSDLKVLADHIRNIRGDLSYRITLHTRVGKKNIQLSDWFRKLEEKIREAINSAVLEEKLAKTADEIISVFGFFAENCIANNEINTFL